MKRFYILLDVYDYDCSMRHRWVKHYCNSEEQARNLVSRLTTLKGIYITGGRTGGWLDRNHGIYGFIDKIEGIFTETIEKEKYMGNAKVTENRDKRSVSTDALESLGMIIGENEKRDAIHLAVEPVIAGERLCPGQDVGIENGKAYNVSPSSTVSGKAIKHLGIVDPFLKTAVMPDQKFWLIIYPRQITSLRHVWSHPDFEEATVSKLEYHAKGWDQYNLKTSEAIERLNKFAEAERIDYNDLIEHATDHAKHGGTWNEGERFEGVYQYDGFWDDLETVTGIKNVHDDWFFSCSC